VLQRAGIDAVVGELEPTGVAQHVRMNWEEKFGQFPGPADHFEEPSPGYRSTAFGVEDEAALQILPPQLAQCSDLLAELAEGLGKKRLIDFQGASERPPKPSPSESDDQPDLVVDSADLAETAREVPTSGYKPLVIPDLDGHRQARKSFLGRWPIGLDAQPPSRVGAGAGRRRSRMGSAAVTHYSAVVTALTSV
jgi:hypothetical protein